MNNFSKSMPFIKGNRFYNYPDEPSHFSFGDLFKTASSSLLRKIMQPKQIEKKLNKHILTSQQPLITWLGHATFLIQTQCATVITDPVLDSPSMLLQRLIDPYHIEALPPIDFIIISHNHRDHLDLKSIELLKKHNPHIKILLPFGDARYFDSSTTKTVEHAWWQTTQYNTIGFTFLPARHWSQRTPFDYNKSLWGSWMIQDDNHTIYFAGDSAYDDHFVTIAHHYPTIDCALLPIGPCEPRALLKDVHMNAEEAGQAFIDLRANSCIPMHWGTFLLGDTHIDAPIKRFITWWNETYTSVIDTKKLYLPSSGSSITLVASIAQK
jgi:L-ascorbate metabolism protein UlaG (beta-lactamase superfamily)